MEGEVFWRVKWIKDEQTKLLDSYESEENLQMWNFNRFDLLKQQALEKTSQFDDDQTDSPSPAKMTDY